jgi:hypothetical protein
MQEMPRIQKGGAGLTGKAYTSGQRYRVVSNLPHLFFFNFFFSFFLIYYCDAAYNSQVALLSLPLAMMLPDTNTRCSIIRYAVML